MNPIPWYKSNTLRALLVAGLAQLVTILGVTDAVTSEDITNSVDKFLDIVSLVATAWAAWARSRQPTPPVTQTAALKTLERERQGGHAGVGFLLIITAIAASILIQACANNPVKTSVDLVVSACAKDADYRIEDCVGGTLGVYEIWQRQGVAFATNASTPAEVKAAIKAADAAATPVMLALLDAERTYSTIKAEVAAGTTSDEQLQIAIRNLERYVLLAQPKIEALISALGG